MTPGVLTGMGAAFQACVAFWNKGGVEGRLVVAGLAARFWAQG